MQLKVLKALWGMTEGVTVDDKIRLIQEAGYDGVECGCPDMEASRWNDLLEKYHLDYIGMIFAHEIASFREQLEAIQAYHPIMVVAHSGRDKMTFEEGRGFLREALKAEADLGIPVAHETHRMRLFYAPWTTAAFLKEFPNLRLNADFSHWCVVCESLLEDMQDMVDLACSRTIHIHGRVGYREGPQVPDPRAPESQEYVQRHESWWDAIRKARLEAGADCLTFTPEFGPPEYLHTLPFTRQPVSDLWDICLWSAKRIRERWGS